MHSEVSFGDKWAHETLTTGKIKGKKKHTKERTSGGGRQRGESAPCAVLYNLALWFLSRGHVANFPHRRYSFPLLHLSLNPPASLNAPTFSGPPLPSPPAPGVIRAEISLNCTEVGVCEWNGYFSIKGPQKAYCQVLTATSQAKRTSFKRHWTDV